MELLVLQGAQLRFGAANFRVPSERGSPPGIFKCARPRSTGTPRNRGRAREGKEHFEGGFHFFQKFSKGRTSVPNARDLEQQCRRTRTSSREKWCGGGGGDDPICLPRKKLGGKALSQGSGTAGEKSEISPRELAMDCVPPPPHSPMLNTTTPAYPRSKGDAGELEGTTPSAFPENIGGKGVEARERHGGGGAGEKERDSGESIRNLQV